MKLLKYFDLNRRTSKVKKFDRKEITDTRNNFIQQWMFPSAVSVKPRGDILSSLWTAFTQREEGQLSLADQLLTIVPVAFEKLSINPKSLLLVRFGLFVQNGVFWDVLFQAIASRR